jgi:DNA-binding transcriptional LysR family regulator
MASLELHQLRQVIALAEHGSFVRAATALHISQPALSRSIQNLERRFGAELFQRSSSGVVPTDRGRLYIERARDLLRMADDLDSDVRADRSLAIGKVAVGSGPFPAESFMAVACARLLERYPQVVIRVHSAPWDELLPRLRSRELDFFVAETSTLQREPDLEIEPLPGQHALHFVVRGGHPLAHQANVTVADVLAYPFVVPSRVPPRVLKPLLQSMKAGNRNDGMPRTFPSVQVSSVEQMKRLMLASDAASGSILWCIKTELENGQLVVVADAPWLHLDYGIVRLKDRPLTHHATEFAALARAAQREIIQEEEKLLPLLRRRRRRSKP